MTDLLIKCNVGVAERQIRALIGVIAVVAGFLVLQMTLKTVLFIVGIYLLLAAAIRYCPINHLLGVKHGQPGYRSVRQILRRI